jgi:hypothetical protein
VKYVVTWRSETGFRAVYYSPEELQRALDMAAHVRRQHRGRRRVIIGAVAT